MKKLMIVVMGMALGAGASVAASMAQAEPSGSRGKRAPLIVNEPAEHFFYMCSKPRLSATDGKPSAFADLLDFRFPPDITCTEQGAERYVDAIAGSNTTHLFVNVNYQRSFFPSRVIEPVWTSLDEPDRTKSKSVRDRMSAYIREAVARYDVDGVELDLIRFPFYFRKGTEVKNAPILTAFVREIRGICTAEAGRRGHPMKIAVRLLPDPQHAMKMGVDVGTWAREGLVDMVIVCNMYGSIEYEYRLGDWRKLLGDKVLLVAGTDNGIVENGKRRVLNLDEYRRWIDLMRRDGADGIYFFNFPLRPFLDETWRGILGDRAMTGS